MSAVPIPRPRASGITAMVISGTGDPESSTTNAGTRTQHHAAPTLRPPPATRNHRGVAGRGKHRLHVGIVFGRQRAIFDDGRESGHLENEAEVALPSGAHLDPGKSPG